MKDLILLRHAKSSWDTPGLNDFDRPLNKKGLKNVPLIGSILKNKYGIKPDLIISSPALRAKQTTEIISQELEYPLEKIKYTQRLYSASFTEILSVLHSINEEYNCVILVGHNPALTEASNFLSEKYVDNIPTCGIVKSSFKGEWKELKQKNCKIDFFIYPKLFITSI